MKRLVVLAAGSSGSSEKWHPLIDRLRQEDAFSNSDWLFFNHFGFWNIHAFSKYFTKSIESLSLELKAKIEEYYLMAIASGQPYEDIICIGHSVGGLMVRQAYLQAAGAYAGIRKSDVSWAEKVSRFILIASLNRGFEPESLLLSIVTNLSNTIGFIPCLRDMVRGSAFITNLRIAWIRYMSSLKGQEPVMIQLLGTQDCIVKREDSIDLKQFPNGIQLDIPDVNHDKIFRPTGRDLASREEWERRYKLLRWTILECEPKSSDRLPAELQGSATISSSKESSETATVFIVHGIRDSNSGWASQLEEQIRQYTNNQFAVIRSTYGYFSAFNFFFPWLRRQNIRWFQDQYSYHFALNPQAEFYFIGHSNGTYILGESLKRVSAMKFKRVYLAGSVLPCEYPWSQRFDLDQVQEVRNDRSCWDWPVGLLCSALRGLGMRDIGTAGFDGFRFADNRRIQEVYYYNGGHGEPLAEENQGDILKFILSGNRSRPPQLLKPTQISSQFQWISRLAPYLAPALLLLVLCIVFLWIQYIFQGFAWDNLGFWLKLIVSLTFVYTIYAVAKTA